MELTIGERLMLLNILPKEGDFLSLKLVRSLREAVSETLRRENEAGNLKQEGNGFTWGQDNRAEVEIVPRAQTLIVERLNTLNQQKKLTDQHLSLYEKFVGD